MDRFVKHISLLEHGAAAQYAKTAYKRYADFKKVLVALAALEEQYFDGRVLRKGGAAVDGDLQRQYDAVMAPLEAVKEAPPAAAGVDGDSQESDRVLLAQLQLYCTLRCQLVGLYRDIFAGGVNVVDYIPKLRSLLTSCTDLKAERCSRARAEPSRYLYALMQQEIEFLLSVHECLWETNRLQYSAAVVHLAAARRKLKDLDSQQAQVKSKLITALLALYAAAYAKVTLVFLRILHDPTSHATEPPAAEPEAGDAQPRDTDADAADATARMKETIDAAQLAGIWPVCKKTKRGKEGGDPAANVLRALDALREEAQGRMGAMPSFHVFYNASAYGFTDTLNLSATRQPLPRYIPCGQRELDEGNALTGLRGFPCIASYPVSCAFPQSLLPLLSTLPLMDAGRVEFFPATPIIEVFDPTVVERARLAKLKAQEAQRKEDTRKALTSIGPSTCSMSTLETDGGKQLAKARRPFPSGFSLASESFTQGEVNNGSVEAPCEDEEAPEALELSREETAGSKSLTSRASEPLRTSSQRGTRPAARATPDKAEKTTPSPKASRPPVTVAAVRIDLLLYAVVLFEGVPDKKWITDWLDRFARCMGTMPTLSASS
eukprot:TRINITY_DN6945_c0_g2_i1.p1 TRINITY_DN6945_c0_g2~~TRINITY_DN6945_c0_g2_i1.p1  ORF type:complete len:605 (+),score=177.05 TRINITY_DN6945_c0_g2_i1:139-1953(+)